MVKTAPRKINHFYTAISTFTDYIKMYVYTFVLFIYETYKVSWYPVSYVELSVIESDWTGNLCKTPQQNVKCFCIFVFKFKNFLNTWHCSINTNIHTLTGNIKFISTSLEPERKAHQWPFFFLFLKLVQIHFIFADNVHILSIAHANFRCQVCVSTWRSEGEPHSK